MKTTHLLLLSAACLVTVLLRVSGAELTLGTTALRLDSVIALSLICGAGLRSWKAMMIPLAVRLATDVIIQLKTGYGFWPGMWIDYAAYAAITLGAMSLSTRRYSAVGLAAVLGPLLYFAASNFGVWAMWPDTYEQSLAGLVQCYVSAVPFLKGSLASNMVFTGVFFTGWNVATAFQESRNEATQPVA